MSPEEACSLREPHEARAAATLEGWPLSTPQQVVGQGLLDREALGAEPSYRRGPQAEGGRVARNRLFQPGVGVGAGPPRALLG